MDDSYSISAVLPSLATASDRLPEAIDLSHHLSLLARSRPPHADLAPSLLPVPRSPAAPPRQLGHLVLVSFRLLRSFSKYFSRPGILMLAGGLPPPEYFPFENISATSLASNTFKTASPGLLQSAWNYIKGVQTDHFTINKYEEDASKIQLSSALQYGTAAGLPPLAQFIYDFTARVYRPAYSDFRTVINAGSTDAWGKVITTLAESGDGVLCEEWTYPSALATAWPNGIKPVPLPMDGEGMTPEGMDDLLANWNPEDHDGMRRPRILYTVPVCQNPTGATMSLKRKEQIYALAVKYDVIIVEDDPYYFLQAPEYERQGSKRAASKPSKTETDEEFLKSLVPSYLAIDYQGRVVRIDTFSSASSPSPHCCLPFRHYPTPALTCANSLSPSFDHNLAETICPGSRLGWTVCNPVFAERIEKANESSTQSASGFAQALVGKLLVEQWGFTGIKAQYRDRRDVLVDYLLDQSHASLDARQSSAQAWEIYTSNARGRDEKGFLRTSEKGMLKAEGKKLMSFVAPMGGMFVWLRVHFASHPLYGVTPTSTLLQQLWEELAEANVLVAPGTMFSGRTFGTTASQEEGPEVLAITEEGDGFFRIAFSSATEAQMKDATRIIGRVVEEFFRV
ncbi:SPOSA6832_01805 [Sporobolomyces salmonicolor]|uniref:SPOSA6832_01805-mRNA-1:cds n=1 Tax=Sporidiobolus salmonicolor TaxID=5005 RepID=A0A0D6EJZ3_SPOSA|nr:SPOSA6832_01805 [Sporobolomyces salmonicolor]